MTNNMYSEILLLLESIPFGPEREKMLRLELAKAWDMGYNECYNDGGTDSNPYMTTREILERNERITGEHNEFLRGAKIREELRKAVDEARVTASITGSVGATCNRTWTDHGDEITVTAYYTRAGYECEKCGNFEEHFHQDHSVKPKA